MRGAPNMKCGPTSLRSSMLVSTDSGKLMVMPVAMATPKEFICSPIQAKGKNERYSSLSSSLSTFEIWMPMLM